MAPGRASWNVLLLPLLAAIALPGCKDKAREMSQYPYFVEMLDWRWETLRRELKQDRPDLRYIVALMVDMNGAREAMARTYHRPNRDAALAKMDEVRSRFNAEMRAKVRIQAGSAALLGGVTEKDLKETLERLYAQYLELKSLLTLR